MNKDNAYINDVCPVCAARGAYYHRIDSYTIDRCGSCGFVFVKNIPSDFDLFKSYDQGYKENDGAYRPNIRKGRELKYWLLSKMIELVSRRNKTRLLEIGCNHGALLNAVKNNHSFDAEGIDYAQAPVEYARSIGLKVTQSSLVNMRYPSESFDFVVALHVIEHVQNLAETFQEITRILNSGGHLYIVVPCVSHIKAKLAGRKWKYLGPPGHLWYFTAKSFRTFLEQRGYRVSFSSCLSNRAHLRVLAQKI
jgi:SAM-dependent methyltransferase